MREQLPRAGDRFSQVFHDALNATRIQLHAAIGERPERVEAVEPPSDFSMMDLLEEVAAVHSPHVRQRAIHDLLMKRTGANMGHVPGPFALL